MSKIYKIDATKFIDWMLVTREDIIGYTEDLKYDLKTSGEFIITAQGILDSAIHVPGRFAIPPQEDEDDELEPCECELVYTKTYGP